MSLPDRYLPGLTAEPKEAAAILVVASDVRRQIVAGLEKRAAEPGIMANIGKAWENRPAWADKTLAGAGIGAGLGLLRGAVQPSRKKHMFSDMLTGGLMGGSLGFGLHQAGQLFPEKEKPPDLQEAEKRVAKWEPLNEVDRQQIQQNSDNPAEVLNILAAARQMNRYVDQSSPIEGVDLPQIVKSHAPADQQLDWNHYFGGTGKYGWYNNKSLSNLEPRKEGGPAKFEAETPYQWPGFGELYDSYKQHVPFIGGR